MVVAVVWCPWVSQGPNPNVHSSPNVVCLNVDAPLWLDHVLEADDVFVILAGNQVPTEARQRTIPREMMTYD